MREEAFSIEIVQWCPADHLCYNGCKKGVPQSRYDASEKRA
jgi:hypothetical protein